MRSYMTWVVILFANGEGEETGQHLSKSTVHYPGYVTHKLPRTATVSCHAMLCHTLPYHAGK